MVAVHVCVGTDDHLVPSEVHEIEVRHILGPFVVDFHAAAKDLQQVGDNLAFEDLAEIRFQAVEDLAADRHDALKFCVPAQLDRAQGRVALHDIELTAFCVLRAAVHKFLNPVGDIHIAGELLLDVEPGLLRGLAAALVDEDLLGDFPRVKGVFDEIDFHLTFEKIGHGLLDEFIVDGLFRLIFIGGLGGKVVGDKDQTILDIVPGDLALRFLVFALLTEIGVDG